MTKGVKGGNPAPILPTTREEMLALGWREVDVVLVTGDAYVDHPSFGIALIGRLLESLGLRVAILSQPRHHDASDFKCFGKPRLFWGITSGQVDSIVSNYTSNARVRDIDVYSPDGNPYFSSVKEPSNRRRPDRALIRYSQLARQAYPDVPIVLGGIEASLRRFCHFDYKQERLRGSILTDSKADLLVYGMGEKAVTEIARRLSSNQSLSGIAGSCEILTHAEANQLIGSEKPEDGMSAGLYRDEGLTLKSPVILPCYEECLNSPEAFLSSELILEEHSRRMTHGSLMQRQQALWVIQHPPMPALTPFELDALHSLPFSGQTQAGDVPALRMIRDSITIVRGCPGGCSFCAITRHQGPRVVSRSHDSIVKEAERLVLKKAFNGVISDLGGPTANLYAASCRKDMRCKRHDCLYPTPCHELKLDEKAFISLLSEVSALPSIKHCFVSSGLRMELLLKTPDLLRKIVSEHTSGRMKIAPEHTEDEVLRLMHKPGSRLLEDFLMEYKRIKRDLKGICAYLISAHPGATLEHANNMAKRLKKLGLAVRQFQDFTPTPATLSTAMYVSGLDRDKKTPIYVPKRRSERMQQRKTLERLLGERKTLD